MHTLGILCINFMHRLGRWLSAQVTVEFNDSEFSSLLTTTCEKPARMVWGPRDPFCNYRFWGRWCTTLHVTPKFPKQRVDQAVLWACQRCSPLTQTYGKSACMVWGRRDHFCAIRVFVGSHETCSSCDFWRAFLLRVCRR
jgi:hypothetical protein